MSQENQDTEEVKKRTQISEEEKQARREQVLTQGRPSITRSIADAVVIKNCNIFFLSKPDGNVPLDGEHGYGLYYHDCRYLNGYSMKLANTHLNVLVSSTTTGYSAIFELTNPEFKVGEGEHIPLGTVGITWERALDGERLLLSDRISLKNYSQDTVEFPLSLTFCSEFEDVFAIRGLFKEQPGDLKPPEWKDGELMFQYEGGDGLYRALSVYFSSRPDKTEVTTAHFGIKLGPRESREIRIVQAVSETQTKKQLPTETPHFPKDIQPVSSVFLQGKTQFSSDSVFLNQILSQAMNDLGTLETSIDGKDFIAAGVPWFFTLFGRDSLITAIQSLPINFEIAAETLRLLAGYQAKEVDDWRDAQPGKILHEHRVGELARLGEIPHTPYYGTVDATPLFLILLVQYTDWTGDLSLFKELEKSVELALDWIDKYGDSDGNGYVEYDSTSKKGLINQGWKDSGNAIINADGSLAKPPISLVEVQGYVYQAKTGMARLYERIGDSDQSDRLRRAAQELRARFNRDFWSADLGTYVLALEANDKPVKVVSSNPGHTLWSGIAEPEKARQTVDRLMAEDMFSGWGIRTLSMKENGYNPIGYHLGTVWPHDNSLIAAGFRRYGYDDAAHKIYMGILEAAIRFDNFRLPELFAGFPRKNYGVPVNYPIACHPQAWSAGSILYLTYASLGLEPDAVEKKLRIVRPDLPDFADFLQVRELQVGEASIDLRFERKRDGRTFVEVQKIDGDLEVLRMDSPL